MICLPDTNAVIKLAAFDLLREALPVLRTAPPDVYILTETRKLCASSKFTSEYGRPALKRAQTFIKTSTFQPKPLALDEIDLLTSISGIDLGEAVMFAATKNYTAFVVVTDDKNCLRALAEEKECEHIFLRLQGKVVCVEDLLLRILANHPYNLLRTKLRLKPDCIGALSQTLKQDESCSQERVENALRADLERLRRETNFILAPAPP